MKTDINKILDIQKATASVEELQTRFLEEHGWKDLRRIPGDISDMLSKAYPGLWGYILPNGGLLALPFGMAYETASNMVFEAIKGKS